MASPPETLSMALFCDFENVALGVRDAKYEKFDIKLVLERLLLKGSIVVKKAYCDWERYKSFKATMHEANFELIEIPHVRQSGKNSADIRLVVDALDLCYTKSHVNTFVVISGDSDFSPLVSKLRENAKQVIGVGVQQSTSDLLIANCDEFIFYDDLVRESQRTSNVRRDSAKPTPPSARRAPEEAKPPKEDLETRRGRAIEIAVQTFDALATERGDGGKIWASVLKNAIKRRKPDFNETYYGFRAFGNLLEEAQARGLLEFGRDEKSGTYVYRSNASVARSDSPSDRTVSQPTDSAAQRPGVIAAGDTSSAASTSGTTASDKHETRRKGRSGRSKPAPRGRASADAGHEQASAAKAATCATELETTSETALPPAVEVFAENVADTPLPATHARSPEDAEVPDNTVARPAQKPRSPRSSRKTVARKSHKSAEANASRATAHEVPTVDEPQPDAAVPSPTTAPDKPAAKKTTRGRRPRKTTASSDSHSE
ncbi:NYN domain-containing protein [Paraburkholderia hayleyella]|uniref:NYN domain-containing protein n=1 Tax=Paraburkholderia hayleyella TaxID=2152889 RepID=UPI001290C8EE|nr:NYN domain-containing protein [Paraburkholderia hayleyella]